MLNRVTQAPPEFGFVHVKFEGPVRRLGKELGTSLVAVDIGRGFKPGQESKREPSGVKPGGEEEKPSEELELGGERTRGLRQTAGLLRPGAETVWACPLPGPWSRPSWSYTWKQRCKPSSE